jgi:hypothetical protein
MSRNVQLAHATFRERGFTLLELLVVARGGLGNSESAISGSLAQPKPCRIRPAEEQHEEDGITCRDSRIFLYSPLQPGTLHIGANVGGTQYNLINSHHESSAGRR